MSEIKYCPFRTRKEKKMTEDGGFIETENFMPCIGDDCPSFYETESGDYFNPEFYEHCKKIEKKKKKKKW